MKQFKNIPVFIITILTIACNDTTVTKLPESNTAINTPKNMTYEIVKTYPHAITSYTEGLEWNNNTLIESTGNYKESKLILMDTNMKNIQNPIQLEDAYFGEGTTLFKDKIYQLTYKEHKVFVYDAKSLKKIQEFYWPYEGWGMTHNDTAIIINTGGSSLYYVDPNTFNKIKTVDVYDNNGYVANVNELEYVNGKLFANVYMTDNILQIDPATGEVKAVANMANILASVGIKEDPKLKDSGNVLNGIAYHKQRGTFFITGKYWPVIIELKFNYEK